MSKKKKNKKRELEEAPAAVPVMPAWQLWLAAACIIGAGLLAYKTSFKGVLLFDDNNLIIENRDIQHLWPPWGFAFGPKTISRPVVGLTLALNYAISGLNPWSYHVFNLGAHILAALTLFGIVRRTLLTPRLRERFGSASLPAAFCAALLWMLHPLQTQSVTYVIQRCESLMGLFYLLTLYCVIRGFDSARQPWWHGAAILSCVLGAGCKQVIATAPLVVLLYDIIFLSGSIAAALKRWRLYGALAATWIIFVVTLAASPKDTSAGFNVASFHWWEYALTQPAVILHYLRLAFWPDPLCLDYNWAIARTAEEIVPPLLAILALLGTTAWTLRSAPTWGFCGAWFFLILAPTSSILPIYDIAFEHRMYLSLAAILAGVVCGAYLACRWILCWLFPLEATRRYFGWPLGTAATVALAAMLGYLTSQRNLDYQDEVRMWRDVVAQRPNNNRGHSSLSRALNMHGDVSESFAQAQAALQLNPNFVNSHFNMASALIKQGKLDEALQQYREVLKLKPNSEVAHSNMGGVYYMQNKLDEAIKECEMALKINPEHVEAHFNLGLALARSGKEDEALKHYEEALRLKPDYSSAADKVSSTHLGMGLDLEKKGKTAEALVHFREALRVLPNNAQAAERLKHYDATPSPGDAGLAH